MAFSAEVLQKELDLSHYYQVRDLSPLVGLTQLIKPWLNHCEQVSDLGPLAGLTQLTSLNLSDREAITR